MSKIPQVGVGVLVFDETKKLLLGKRLSHPGHGTWQLPGGNLNYGETIMDCARRELYEETGLMMSKGQKGPWVDVLYPDVLSHFVSTFVVTHAYQGQVVVREPEKCEAWHWFNLKSLPSPLFLPMERLLLEHRHMLEEYTHA